MIVRRAYRGGGGGMQKQKQMYESNGSSEDFNPIFRHILLFYFSDSKKATVLEFLNNLWGLGTDWRNLLLRIDSWLPLKFENSGSEDAKLEWW